eukprot:2738947-Rhodomonas_salina.1
MAGGYVSILIGMHCIIHVPISFSVSYGPRERITHLSIIHVMYTKAPLYRFKIDVHVNNPINHADTMEDISHFRHKPDRVNQEGCQGFALIRIERTDRFLRKSVETARNPAKLSQKLPCASEILAKSYLHWP